MSASFYTDLPVHTHFRDVADPAIYTPVPEGWQIAVTDVEGSTRAVEDGRYREVNLVGASSIIALLNLEEDLELAFAFGGDGAAVLLPPALAGPARSVLADTRTMAAEEFGLSLRTGLVPVEAVREAGHDVRVARLRMAEASYQAMFAGGGLAHAETLIKDEETGAQYAIPPGVEGPAADFSGLECRWQDIPSPREETVALVVQATAGDVEADRAAYRDVLEQIEDIYGSEDRYRPLSFDVLKPSFSPKKLSEEARVQQRGGGWRRRVYQAGIWMGNVLLKYLMQSETETRGFDRAGTPGGVHWGRYIEHLVATSDFRKYDGALRMVIAGAEAERQQLVQFLEEEHAAGRLAYGLHVTDRALLTCVVFERMGRQVHFVDGADGGYTQAARALKTRLGEAAGAEG